MIIKVLDNGIILPEVASKYSAGVDLRVTSFKKLYKGCREVDISKLDNSIKNGYFTLRGHERVLCGTGLFIELPIGTYLSIIPRSGVALKRGLTVVNSPGTIDSDYRNEVGIIIINTTPYLNRIEMNERLAQAILLSHIPIEWELVNKLSEIDRGGGYGSTGTS